MYQDIIKSMRRWNSATNEREKLQHTYLTIAIATIVVSGLVSLVNVTLGRRLTVVALVAIGAFLLNFIVWHLVNSAVASRLNSRRKSSK